MARPSTPASVQSGHNMSKEDKERLAKAEEEMLNPPTKVYEVPEDIVEKSESWAYWYTFIVEELRASNLLKDIDIPVIRETSYVLYMMEESKRWIDEEGQIIRGYDKNGNEALKQNPAIQVYNNMLSQFKTLAVSLGMTPSARSSMAKATLEDKSKKESPLLKALGRV